MFKVEFHLLGEGLWSRGGLPMTQLGAAYMAETLQHLGFADEARVVPAHSAEPSSDEPGDDHALDIRV